MNIKISYLAQHGGVELMTKLCLFEGAEGGMRFLLDSMLNTKPTFFATGSCFLQECFEITSMRLVAELGLTRRMKRTRK